MVHCTPGFDGGLTQLFTIELRYLRTPNSQELLRNVTLSKPEFEVGHLESGLRYEAKIFASNRKGRSTPVTLRVSTLKRPEGKRMATISSSGNSEFFSYRGAVSILRRDKNRVTYIILRSMGYEMCNLHRDWLLFALKVVMFALLLCVIKILIVFSSLHN